MHNRQITFQASFQKRIAHHARGQHLHRPAETPRGIFELKYFFGSHVATEAGGACSATAIRALIKQLVGAEDARKPLSDSQISDLLGQQGIVVARRTIAKYRESLNIPPVKLRKAI